MTELTYLGCDQDAYCASVARHIHSFEESTGHKAHVRILDNDEYFSNRLGPYLEGENPADVYMSGPVLVWQHYGAGYVEPLDPFLARASSGYDPDDFSRPCFDATGGAGDSASRSELGRCSKSR